MIYLIAKIAFDLVGSFALGFALAWLVWRAAEARREREMTSRWERRLGDLQRERDTSLAKLRREVEDHRQQIPTLESSLADRSDLIARLEGDLADWRAKLPDLEARLRERDEKLSELTASARDKDELIESLKVKLEAAQNRGERDSVARAERERAANDEATRLRANETAARSRVQELEGEIERLSAVTEAATAERDESQRQLNGLRTRLEQQEALRAELATALEAAERGATGDLFGSAQIGSAPHHLLGEPPPEGATDDLKMIRGVGPVLERTLNRLGIYHFAQIAALDEGEVEWVAHHLNTFPGRIARDRWVEQAQKLHAVKHGSAS